MSRDKDFLASITTIEKRAWQAFVGVVSNFLGNRNQIITWKKLINCLFKINFFFILFDKFPENLGDVSGEQGERFPLDIKVMEERYQGGWGIHIMADYC